MQVGTTAAALSSSATFIAGLEMLGARARYVLADSSNVTIAVEGISEKNFIACLQATGWGIRPEHTRGGTRVRIEFEPVVMDFFETGVSIEIELRDGIAGQGSGELLPRGFCALAASIAAMTECASVEMSTRRNVTRLVVKTSDTDKSLAMLTPYDHEDSPAYTITTGSHTTIVIVEPPYAECNSCHSRGDISDLIYCSDPYYAEVYPESPEAKEKMWLCGKCYKASCDDI